MVDVAVQALKISVIVVVPLPFSPIVMATVVLGPAVVLNI